jgi:hypothetical protein
MRGVWGVQSGDEMICANFLVSDGRLLAYVKSVDYEIPKTSGSSILDLVYLIWSTDRFVDDIEVAMQSIWLQWIFPLRINRCNEAACKTSVEELGNLELGLP